MKLFRQIRYLVNKLLGFKKISTSILGIERPKYFLDRPIITHRLTFGPLDALPVSYTQNGHCSQVNEYYNMIDFETMNRVLINIINCVFPFHTKFLTIIMLV